MVPTIVMFTEVGCSFSVSKAKICWKLVASLSSLGEEHSAGIHRWCCSIGDIAMASRWDDNLELLLSCCQLPHRNLSYATPSTEGSGEWCHPSILTHLFYTSSYKVYCSQQFLIVYTARNNSRVIDLGNHPLSHFCSNGFWMSS